MENTRIGTGALAGAVPLGAGGIGGERPHTLREATQEFESIFVAQLMQAMRGTVPENGLLGDDSGGKLFREMLDQEFARRIAGTGGFGIGDLLYQQLAGPNAVHNQAKPGQSVDPEAHPNDALSKGKQHTGE